MTAPPDIAAMMRDARWFAHRYDPQQDAVHFLAVERGQHRAAAFVTDEYLPAGLPLVPVRRDAARAAMPALAPVHFIFHSAFCLSTLLARAFDLPGVAMGLKEPPLFNDLQGWRMRGGAGAQVGRVLDDALALLARPFEAGEASIIKPSSIAAGFYDAMLALRPEARALLLHAPLRTFIGSIARKGMWGRLWVRDLIVILLKEGLVDLGFDDEALLRLTDLQIAAVGWIAQHALFARLATKYPARVRTLDSGTLLTRPEAAMAALGALYGLAIDAAAIVAGPEFARHSKLGGDFSPQVRQREIAEGEAAHADEIDKVTIWAEAVAKNAGVALELPAPLIA